MTMEGTKKKSLFAKGGWKNYITYIVIIAFLAIIAWLVQRFEIHKHFEAAFDIIHTSVKKCLLRFHIGGLEHIIQHNQPDFTVRVILIVVCKIAGHA